MSDMTVVEAGSTARPAYHSKAVRLADRLEREIAEGRWPDGCYLPAEEDMARQLEVARMTLRRCQRCPRFSKPHGKHPWTSSRQSRCGNGN
ncbi:MAG: GntR family transcriptional regulator, partial [Planctomycetes bacterium]|nr:GntR family transcriptional regulator [Planctomycetota bacterium]